MSRSLCERCARMREVISGKGSRFLLCRQSQADPRYVKYPPQPIARCEAFAERTPEEPADAP